MKYVFPVFLLCIGVGLGFPVECTDTKRGVSPAESGGIILKGTCNINTTGDLPIAPCSLVSDSSKTLFNVRLATLKGAPHVFVIFTPAELEGQDCKSFFYDVRYNECGSIGGDVGGLETLLPDGSTSLCTEAIFFENPPLVVGTRTFSKIKAALLRVMRQNGKGKYNHIKNNCGGPIVKLFDLLKIPIGEEIVSYLVTNLSRSDLFAAFLQEVRSSEQISELFPGKTLAEISLLSDIEVIEVLIRFTIRKNRDYF